MEAILLKTAILVPGDDIIEVARLALDAAAVIPAPDDVMVICETPLAITQGRIVRLDDMRVSRGGRILNWFMNVDSSIGTVYGMQTAIDLAGFWRILLSMVVAAPLRLLGRHGDFYRMAGRQVAWMDDVTGTMPPYTQDIILGPDDPDGVARAMAKALGCGAAVVDANDYGNFEIMGASPGIDEEMVGQVMRRNPQGNDDEQTPLVLVRP
ncbi:MAG TPA: coenzyme F420-0:L-glutamate ligase [Acidimicrobiales bacterium]|nr:coenzyme F420-0:L-glutamate ligase [Acidimicrobiales bacterium]